MYACSSVTASYLRPRNTEVQQVLGGDVHTVHGSLEAAADLAQPSVCKVEGGD